MRIQRRIATLTSVGRNLLHRAPLRRTAVGPKLLLLLGCMLESHSVVMVTRHIKTHRRLLSASFFTHSVANHLMQIASLLYVYHIISICMYFMTETAFIIWISYNPVDTHMKMGTIWTSCFIAERLIGLFWKLCLRPWSFRTDNFWHSRHCGIRLCSF